MYKSDAPPYERRRPWITIAMLAFYCIFWCNINSVYATSDSIILGANATINAKCTFKTGAVVAFGLYDPISLNAILPRLASSTFDVKCTKNTSSQISLGQGLHAGQALLTTRAMSDGNGNYLSYEIFSNAARTLIWNSLNTVSFTDLGGAATSIPIYALILPAQNVSAGFYSDTVAMTITY